MNNRFGLEPVVIVEIDQDFCALDYGVAPCTAAVGATGVRKCFNTLRTCQDSPNFIRGARTLRFCEPFMEIPFEWQAIPSVLSAKVEPSRLNVGASSKASGALGTRGNCSITFQDHPDGDIKVDKYVTERDYDPFEKGTFWRKWLARNVYYKNRPIRVRQGYLGQPLEEMKVNHFIIDSLSGPDSSGIVTIRGVDILRLIDDDKVQWPPASPGLLKDPITTVSDSLIVLDAELTDYPDVPGTIRIGDEIITYTNRTALGGEITFTGLVRGTDGSVAEDHEDGDRVQRAVRYTDAPVHVVTNELITVAGKVPAGYIPFADWEAESNLWLPQFSVSTLISEPTGVGTLIEALTRECMFYIWWDERVAKIRFRAIRPPDEEVTLWTQEGHLLEGLISPKEDHDQRISQIWVYYQPKNFAGKMNEESNFKKIVLQVDPTSSSRNENDEDRIRKVLARWIRTDAQALNLAARLLARYRETPKFVSIKVDAGERENAWTADTVDLICDLFTDFIGDPIVKRWQVISARETMNGEVVQFELQSSEFTGGRFAFWMRDDAPIFSLATDIDKAAGAWWSDDDGLQLDGSPGYTWQ